MIQSPPDASDIRGPGDGHERAGAPSATVESAGERSALLSAESAASMRSGRSAVARAPGAAPGVGRRGLLVKKGHVLRTHKERLFVLQGATLRYFRVKKRAARGAWAIDDPRVCKLKGTLQLEATDVVTPTKGSDQWFCVRKLAGPDGKSYKLELKAQNAQERQAWIEALRAACRVEAVSKQKSVRSGSVRRPEGIPGNRNHVSVNAKSRVNVLRESESSRALSPRAELRASFQMLHELVVLQKLVGEAKSSWGKPRDWTVERYHELVRSINLAQENMGSSEIGNNVILAEAFALRYQFEEIAENQRKLSRENAAPADRPPSIKPLPLTPPSSPSEHTSSSPTRTGSDGVPLTTQGYFSTFEKLLSSRKPNSTKESVAEKPLTPRHATMAKYARLYLESDERAKQPWAIERMVGDSVRDKPLSSPWSDDDVGALISSRFESDRMYAWLSDHSMLTVNPFRILQTSKFTSIYAEDVVLTYAAASNAARELAPHPFAVAKMAISRAFVDSVINKSPETQTPPKHKSQTIWLCGESGSGKTELAKELLKYFVLVAEPVLTTTIRQDSGEKVTKKAASRPRIQLFTSSTKSTVQMRTEEARTIALLEAKGVQEFEIVLLDLNPERWCEMEAVSHSRRLPQLHVDGLFFGFYDKLEHLDDIEQLRLYLKNPRAAKKLSMVLDSNVVLEAFGHAVTEMNSNSSRFGKTIDVDLVMGRHPGQFEVRGCRIAPFLLEKSRVTLPRIGKGTLESNFHIFYAMVGGVNAVASHKAGLAADLRLAGASCDAFAYLGERGSAKSSAVSARNAQEALKRDAEKWLRILDALEAMNITNNEQRAIFKILSAILWLGNIEFETETHADGERVKITSSSRFRQSAEPSAHVSSLLGLQSVAELSRMLTTKRVSMTTTGETYELKLEKGQVGHVRDALARLLYQSVFLFIVGRMNTITQPESDSQSEQVSRLKVVDVFGFEALQHNSLDQLCINYLSEKLFFLQDEIFTAICLRDTAADQSGVTEALDNNVLSLFEHPSSGIFACLEEVTILHQGENESTEQERKKNALFVRNVLERSAALAAETSSINGKKNTRSTSSLLFAVPHSRCSVVYDADEFVKKNSDFVYASLLEDLASSCTKDISLLLSNPSISTPEVESKLTAATLVRQFRVQVNALTQTSHRDGRSGIDDRLNRSFYFHCVRPNASARHSGADQALILQQVRAQRLTRQINLSEGLSKSFYPVSFPVHSLLKRYGCLVECPVGKRSEEVARISLSENVSALTTWVHTLIHPNCTQLDCKSVCVNGMTVQLKSLADVEELEKKLALCEEKAAATIQAMVRMRMCRLRYLATRERRRSLAGDLLDFYGSDQHVKVQKILLKYQGREEELEERLRAKRIAKAQSEHVIATMTKELHSLCLADGGLNATVIGEILNDDSLRIYVLRNEAIVGALRDVSLNPAVLQGQLADPALREFYEKLLVFMRERASRVQLENEEDKEEESVSLHDGQLDLSLEERVRTAVAENHSLWMSLAGRSEWKEHRSGLEEIGEDPEMLVFHIENDSFAQTLASFVDAFEEECNSNSGFSAIEEGSSSISNMTDGATVDLTSGADAELIELLLTVQFNSALLEAMRGDAYFAQALQDPLLASSLQQVMASGGHVEAASAMLQSPIVREFLLKLIALSFAIQGGDDESSSSDEDYLNGFM